MGPVERSRSGSGAVLAAVSAVCATGCSLSLRADSVSTAPPAAVLLAALALGLLLWPLAARTTRVLTLAAVLAAAQVGTQALTLALSGDLVSGGARAVVCCPATPGSGSGPIESLTANAGWWLFGAQLAACLVLAVALRGARSLTDTSLAALDAILFLTGVLLAPWRRLLLALRLLVAVDPVHVRAPRRDAAHGTLGAGLLVVGAIGRRGPPSDRAPRRAAVLIPSA